MESNMEKMVENNQVVVMGCVVSKFVYNHEIFGEKFYMVDVEVKRISDTSDCIPVMFSDRLINVEEDLIGRNIAIYGQFRSYNRHEEGKSRLILSVFAKDYEFMDEVEAGVHNNQIYLSGYICKSPIYRKTPLGREITDLLIAVNRPYGKSDYIPCICWGRTARFASNLDVGSPCFVWGRIQSREYTKKISEDEAIRRTAYEVSVNRLDEVSPEMEMS